MKEKKTTQVNGCKQCQKGLSKVQSWMVVFSIYMLLTSIYGTVVLFQKILELF
jgi:hypothetical protein